MREDFYKPKTVNFSVKSTKNLDEALSMVLKNLQRVNEFDYDSMLHEFKAEEAMIKRQKEIHQKYKKQNKKWIENLESMKGKRELQMRKWQREIKEKMNKKKEIVERVTKQNKEEKDNEIMEKILREEKSNMFAKSKIEKSRELAENTRLEYKEKTEKNLMTYSTLRQFKLEEDKSRIQQSMRESQSGFLERIKTEESKTEQKFEDLKHKRFLKFERLFINLKKKKRLELEDEHKKNEQREKFEQNKQKIEKKRIQIGEAIKKKLLGAENYRKEKEEKDKEKLHQEALKLKEKIEVVKEKRKDIQKSINEKNMLGLERQMLFLRDSVEKDMNMTFTKQNFIEKTIVNQMELEKKLKTFYGGLDELKEQSILKKNEKAKRDIWNDLKLKERLKREKEKEELDKKMGLA